MKLVKRKGLIYPELSSELLGLAFEVFNDLGWGHKEIYYQRAYATGLELLKLRFEQEKYITLSYKGEMIGR